MRPRRQLSAAVSDAAIKLSATKQKRHFRYYRFIFKQLEMITLLMERQNMRIYRVGYMVTIKPNKGPSFQVDEKVDVSAMDADRASEKVKNHVLKKRPETEYVDGVKTTYKNIDIVIDSVSLVAEADY